MKPILRKKREILLDVEDLPASSQKAEPVKEEPVVVQEGLPVPSIGKGISPSSLPSTKEEPMWIEINGPNRPYPNNGSQCGQPIPFKKPGGSLLHWLP